MKYLFACLFYVTLLWDPVTAQGTPWRSPVTGFCQDSDGAAPVQLAGSAKEPEDCRRYCEGFLDCSAYSEPIDFQTQPLCFLYFTGEGNLPTIQGFEEVGTLDPAASKLNAVGPWESLYREDNSYCTIFKQYQKLQAWTWAGSRERLPTTQYPIAFKFSANSQHVVITNASLHSVSQDLDTGFKSVSFTSQLELPPCELYQVEEECPKRCFWRIGKCVSQLEPGYGTSFDDPHIYKMDNCVPRPPWFGIVVAVNGWTARESTFQDAWRKCVEVQCGIITISPDGQNYWIYVTPGISNALQSSLVVPGVEKRLLLSMPPPPPPPAPYTKCHQGLQWLKYPPEPATTEWPPSSWNLPEYPACVDTPGWFDGTNHCTGYSAPDFCQLYGATDFNGQGPANEHCCICGGGTPDQDADWTTYIFVWSSLQAGKVVEPPVLPLISYPIRCPQWCSFEGFDTYCPPDRNQDNQSPQGIIALHCLDGVKSGNEEAIDCGGDCPPCVGYSTLQTGCKILKNEQSTWGWSESLRQFQPLVSISPPTLPAFAPELPVWGCIDSLASGGVPWTSWYGRSCNQFSSNEDFCAKYGTEQQFTNGDDTAETYCCACGGGQAGAKPEQDDFLYTVSNGDFRMTSEVGDWKWNEWSAVRTHPALRFRFAFTTSANPTGKITLTAFESPASTLGWDEEEVWSFDTSKSAHYGTEYGGSEVFKWHYVKILLPYRATSFTFSTRDIVSPQQFAISFVEFFDWRYDDNSLESMDGTVMFKPWNSQQPIMMPEYSSTGIYVSRLGSTGSDVLLWKDGREQEDYIELCSYPDQIVLWRLKLTDHYMSLMPPLSWKGPPSITVPDYPHLFQVFSPDDKYLVVLTYTRIHIFEIPSGVIKARWVIGELDVPQSHQYRAGAQQVNWYEHHYFWRGGYFFYYMSDRIPASWFTLGPSPPPWDKLEQPGFYRYDPASDLHTYTQCWDLFPQHVNLEPTPEYLALCADITREMTMLDLETLGKETVGSLYHPFGTWVPPLYAAWSQANDAYVFGKQSMPMADGDDGFIYGERDTGAVTYTGIFGEEVEGVDLSENYIVVMLVKSVFGGSNLPDRRVRVYQRVLTPGLTPYHDSNSATEPVSQPVYSLRGAIVLPQDRLVVQGISTVEFFSLKTGNAIPQWIFTEGCENILFLSPSRELLIIGTHCGGFSEWTYSAIQIAYKMTRQGRCAVPIEKGLGQGVYVTPYYFRGSGLTLEDCQVACGGSSACQGMDHNIAINNGFCRWYGVPALPTLLGNFGASRSTPTGGDGSLLFTCTVKGTDTPTLTASATSTLSLTPTPTQTHTPSATATPSTSATPSPTSTTTPTSTPTPTPSPTASRSATPSSTSTPTPTTTATSTSSVTPTSSSTPTPTPTFTPTQTGTPTETGTPTPSQSVTGTGTPTPTPTSTTTLSAQPTGSNTPTGTATGTQSFSPMATASYTGTPTLTPTATILPTPTYTPTVTVPVPACTQSGTGDAEASELPLGSQNSQMFVMSHPDPSGGQCYTQLPMVKVGSSNSVIRTTVTLNTGEVGIAINDQEQKFGAGTAVVDWKVPPNEPHSIVVFYNTLGESASQKFQTQESRHSRRLLTIPGSTQMVVEEVATAPMWVAILILVGGLLLTLAVSLIVSYWRWKKHIKFEQKEGPKLGRGGSYRVDLGHYYASTKRLRKDGQNLSDKLEAPLQSYHKLGSSCPLASELSEDHYEDAKAQDGHPHRRKSSFGYQFLHVGLPCIWIGFILTGLLGIIITFAFWNGRGGIPWLLWASIPFMVVGICGLPWLFPNDYICPVCDKKVSNFRFSGKFIRLPGTPASTKFHTACTKCVSCSRSVGSHDWKAVSKNRIYHSKCWVDTVAWALLDPAQTSSWLQNDQNLSTAEIQYVATEAIKQGRQPILDAIISGPLTHFEGAQGCSFINALLSKAVEHNSEASLQALLRIKEGECVGEWEQVLTVHKSVYMAGKSETVTEANSKAYGDVFVISPFVSFADWPVLIGCYTGWYMYRDDVSWYASPVLGESDMGYRVRDRRMNRTRRGLSGNGGDGDRLVSDLIQNTPFGQDGADNGFWTKPGCFGSTLLIESLENNKDGCADIILDHYKQCHPGRMWEWEDELGFWHAYTEDIQAQLREMRAKNVRSTKIEIDGDVYVINFEKMQQEGEDSWNNRNVRVSIGPVVAWHADDGEGKLSPLPDLEQEKMKELCLKGETPEAVPVVTFHPFEVIKACNSNGPLVLKVIKSGVADPVHWASHCPHPDKVQYTIPNSCYDQFWQYRVAHILRKGDCPNDLLRPTLYTQGPIGGIRARGQRGGELRGGLVSGSVQASVHAHTDGLSEPVAMGDLAPRTRPTFYPDDYRCHLTCMRFVSNLAKDGPSMGYNFSQKAIQTLLVDFVLKMGELLLQREWVCPIPLKDAFAIYVYTYDIPEEGNDQIYSVLNRVMRNNDRQGIQFWLPLMWHLDNALLRLPTYSGLLYRGINMTFEGGGYEQDKVLMWPAFSSSSWKRAVAETFTKAEGDTGSTLFFLNSLCARDVSYLSRFRNEGEALFLGNTPFRVKHTLFAHTNVGKFFSKCDNIEMDEVCPKAAKGALKSAKSSDLPTISPHDISYHFDRAGIVFRPLAAQGDVAFKRSLSAKIKSANSPRMDRPNVILIDSGNKGSEKPSQSPHLSSRSPTSLDPSEHQHVIFDDIRFELSSGVMASSVEHLNLATKGRQLHNTFKSHKSPLNTAVSSEFPHKVDSHSFHVYPRVSRGDPVPTNTPKTFKKCQPPKSNIKPNAAFPHAVETSFHIYPRAPSPPSSSQGNHNGQGSTINAHTIHHHKGYNTSHLRPDTNNGRSGRALNYTMNGDEVKTSQQSDRNGNTFDSGMANVAKGSYVNGEKYTTSHSTNPDDDYDIIDMYNHQQSPQQPIASHSTNPHPDYDIIDMYNHQMVPQQSTLITAPSNLHHTLQMPEDAPIHHVQHRNPYPTSSRTNQQFADQFPDPLPVSRNFGTSRAPGTSGSPLPASPILHCGQMSLPDPIPMMDV